MKYLKPILGILLIASAVFCLIYWETGGREKLTTNEVIIAAEGIPEGAIIAEEHLKTAPILKDNLIENAVTEQEKHLLIGEISGTDILKNQQISLSQIKKGDYEMKENHAPFPIKAEWIDGMSSSIRQGDLVVFYDETGTLFLGEFRVAFAKDSTNQEVVDATEPNAHKEILERTNSNTVLDHIEIEATVEEYAALLKFIEETGLNFFICQGGR